MAASLFISMSPVKTIIIFLPLGTETLTFENSPDRQPPSPRSPWSQFPSALGESAKMENPDNNKK